MAAALVQETSAQGSPISGSPSAITMPGLFTAGNTAFLFLGAFNSNISGVIFGGVAGVGGTAGILVEELTPGGNDTAQFWMSDGPLTGVPTNEVLISYGTGDEGDFMHLRAQEWSGLESSPIDSNPAPSSGGPSANPLCPSTGTLAQADELVIMMGVWGAQGGGITDPVGWSEILARDAWNTDTSIGVSYLIVSATTALQPQWTRDSNGAWQTGIVTLKASAGGGGSAPVPVPVPPTMFFGML